MKINNIICALFFLPLFVSCNDSEDTTPSYADQNVFEPAEDDNSETAQIRRNFYEATGSYLLFNDTLRTVSSGLSTSGEVILKTELLDVMGYAMIGYGNSREYVYDYITSPDAQREAVQLINEHLVWRMGKALPYSFFLVNNISYWDSSKKKNVYETKLLGLRAYAISLNDGAAYDDPETYFRSMIADMVMSKVQTMSEEELAAFYNISGNYYYEYKTDFGLTDKTTSSQDMWNFGFFNDTYGDLFPTYEDDLKLWVSKVTSMSREQFEALYGSAPVMMEKFNALKKIIEEDLGYVLQ